jgi:uncharacterized membrane protein
MERSNIALMIAAWNSLSGRWVVSIAASLIHSCVCALLFIIPHVGLFIYLAICGPLLLGLAHFYLHVQRARTVNIGDVWIGYRSWGLATRVHLLRMLYLMVWLLTILIPILMVMFAHENYRCLLRYKVVWLVGFALFLPFVRALLCYSMTFFIVADHPWLSPFAAISKSASMMKGNVLKLSALFAMFIVLIFTPSALVLLIVYHLKLSMLLASVITWSTLFFSFSCFLPWMNVTMAHFYDGVKGDMKQDNIGEQDTV